MNPVECTFSFEVKTTVVCLTIKDVPAPRRRPSGGNLPECRLVERDVKFVHGSSSPKSRPQRPGRYRTQMLERKRWKQRVQAHGAITTSNTELVRSRTRAESVKPAACDEQWLPRPLRPSLCRPCTLPQACREPIQLCRTRSFVIQADDARVPWVGVGGASPFLHWIIALERSLCFFPCVAQSSISRLALSVLLFSTFSTFESLRIMMHLRSVSVQYSVRKMN